MICPSLPVRRVSIRAPRVRRDRNQIFAELGINRFNPRASREARCHQFGDRKLLRGFQSARLA